MTRCSVNKGKGNERAVTTKEILNELLNARKVLTIFFKDVMVTKKEEPLLNEDEVPLIDGCTHLFNL